MAEGAWIIKEEINMKKLAALILALMMVFGIQALASAEEGPTNLAVAEKYYERTVTGGEIEQKYAARGPYEVSSLTAPAFENYQQYLLYYPTEITETEDKYPVVIFSNGTGIKGSTYTPIMEHLASWGFIVIGTDEEFSWNGFSSEMCLRLLIKVNDGKDFPIAEVNPFYGKVDLDKIGVSGHSQGGVGVINAATDTNHGYMIKTIYSASPTNKELAHGLEWDFDATKIVVPTFLISSTGFADENLVINLEQLGAIFTDVSSDIKLMARRNDGDHGDMLSFPDGYMTAWFMWQLKDDEDAANAFVGEQAEILNNSYYQDIEKTF